MCGIFGTITNKKLTKYHKSIFSDLGILNTQRGSEAFGISSLNSIYKRNEAFEDSINNPRLNQVIREAKNVLLGHTRQSTHGANTVKNCHPFSVNNIVLAHNGVINNVYDLEKITSRKFEVDSQYLAYMISYSNGKQELVDNLNQCKGYYAVYFYNRNKKDNIYFLCNDQELHYYSDGKTFFFSSSKSHLEQALHLEQRVKIQCFKEKYLYKLNIKTLQLSKSKLKGLKDNVSYSNYRYITDGFDYQDLEDYTDYNKNYLDECLNKKDFARCDYCDAVSEVEFYPYPEATLCKECADFLEKNHCLTGASNV